MGLKVGFQMDHVSTIHIEGDSTFALGLEAQSRGHTLYHWEPNALQLRNGVVQAAIEEMTLQDVKGDHFSLSDKVVTDLSELDVIQLRQDPPFDMAYITTTHILERVPKPLLRFVRKWATSSSSRCMAMVGLGFSFYPRVT